MASSSQPHQHKSRRTRGGLIYPILVSLVFLVTSYRQVSQYATTQYNSAVSFQRSRSGNGKKVLHIFKTTFLHLNVVSNERLDTQLRLFETFALPSMVGQNAVRQSNKNADEPDFFWIVSVERNAEQSLIDRLVQLLEPYPHFYLTMPAVLDRKFDGGRDILRKTTPSSFYTGNVTMLWNALPNNNDNGDVDQPQRPIVLETRFDLDDALPRGYAAVLAAKAGKVFRDSDNKSDKSHRDWMYWCATRALEGDWSGSSSSTASGSDLTTNMPEFRPTSETSNDGVNTNPPLCHTSPVTVGMRKGDLTLTLSSENVPNLPSLLQEKAPKCGKSGETKHQGRDCLEFLDDFMEFPVLHARYPFDVNGDDNNNSNNNIQNDSHTAPKPMAWQKIDASFAVSKESIEETLQAFKTRGDSAYLERDRRAMDLIAEKAGPSQGVELRLPANESLPKVYEKPGEIFHIIKTRFMQHQSDLVELGRARLELFKTFCLPSMLHQTTQNFFWLIYVDPELSLDLRDELVELVRPYSNFYVLPSLADRRGLGGKDILQDIKPKQYLTGNTKILFANLKNALKRNLVVLETRLDADDALNINFVKDMQQRGRKAFGGEKSNGREWIWWCVSQELEWHWVAPRQRQQLSTYGALLPSESFMEIRKCFSPGMTVGRGRNYTGTVVRGAHHVLIEDLERENTPCGPHQRGLDCMDFIDSLEFPALRTRTPTSASMANVGILGGKSYRRAAEDAAELWETTVKSFALDLESVKPIMGYLLENMKPVLQEALAGQCTIGHSCRQQAKSMLHYYMGLYTKE